MCGICLQDLSSKAAAYGADLKKTIGELRSRTCLRLHASIDFIYVLREGHFGKLYEHIPSVGGTKRQHRSGRRPTCFAGIIFIHRCCLGL